MSAKRVSVVGVGVTKFAKPGQSEDYPTMVAHAVRAALRDAGVPFTAVQQSYAGYVFGDSTSGQRALYGMGLTGAPIFNVNNACATGSTALMLGRQAIESETVECVLVVGFEEMKKGPVQFKTEGGVGPLDRHLRVLAETQGASDAPLMAQMFGGAGREYRARYGTRKETFAKVAVKARKHAAENPLALFTQPLTVEEVLASEMVYDPLTRLQVLCPDLWRGRRGSVDRGVRQETRPFDPRLHCRPGDDDGLPDELRKERDASRRLRHDGQRGEQGLRSGGARA